MATGAELDKEGIMIAATIRITKKRKHTILEVWSLTRLIILD